MPRRPGFMPISTDRAGATARTLAGKSRFLQFGTLFAGAPNGLDQNEADDADNILYNVKTPNNNGTLEVNGASTSISQIQGNSVATKKITAYDISDSPPARNFVSGLGSG